MIRAAVVAAGLAVVPLAALGQEVDSDPNMTAHAELEQAVANFRAGVSELEQAAEGGSVPALFYLASLKIHGVMVPTDVDGGFEMMERAAEAGYAPAEYVLGQYLSDGLIVNQDEERGEMLLQRAEDKGFSDPTE